MSAFISQIEEKAISGDVEQQLKLGYLYFHGIGKEESVEKAEYWYRKAAVQNDSDAQYLLGILLRDSHQSVDEGKKWIQSAAENGNKFAQYDMAFGTEHELSNDSIHWLIKSAMQGLPEAQTELGKCYAAGNYVNQSDEEAAYWFYKAHSQGNEEATFELGQLYEEGYGVEQSYQTAFMLYCSAVNKGNYDAAWALAKLYLDGQGVEQSFEKAVTWFKKANEYYEDYELGYEIGMIYRYHPYGDNSQEIARLYFERSYDDGNMHAGYELAKMYEEDNSPSSLMSAAEIYEYCAENGHAESQYKIATFYRDGKGLEQSAANASYWFRKAAENGFLQAEDDLEI